MSNFIALVALGIVSLGAMAMADPFKPFDEYARNREAAIWNEIKTPDKFLWVDRLPEAQRQQKYQQLRNGQVLLDKGTRKDVSGGLIHHWTGAVYVPGIKLPQMLTFIRDYNRHATNYAPELMASKLLSQQGNTYRIYQRYLKKKVLTVVLDTEHEVKFVDLDPAHAASFGYTTSIQEVDDPGTPKEKKLSYGQDKGFLWKMYTYWRFVERDGGVYVQCETISLSRDIPFGLGFIIGRFIDSVPRESLVFTLGRTRDKSKG